MTMVDHTVYFKIIKWLTPFFILVLGNSCFGQENIRFERLTVNEGLSQSDVMSMVQDRFGFLWVGTRDGLNKYDGLEFRRYSQKKNDSTSLQFNQILDLEVDSVGNVWIGSAGGISIYNYSKDNFQNFFPTDTELQSADVNDILLTGKYTALLSTSKGLVNFDLKQRRFFVTQDMAVFKGLRVSHTYQTVENALWVGTDKGVFIRKSSTSGWVRLLEDNSIYAIDFDPNGKVYLAASKGLFSYDLRNKKIEQITLPPGIAPVDVRRMKSGDLWVAANKVIVLDKNDVAKYVLAHDKFNNYSLSEDRATVLFQTSDEVIWVGTNGYGLNKFNPDVAEFSYLSEQTYLPLSSNYVSTVFTADDTTLFVGTSRGLDVIDLMAKTAEHFSRSKDLFQIFKIISDHKNNIWISTSDGFMLFSDNRLILKNTSLRSVYYFAEWDDSRLILATRVNGIYLFDRNTDFTSLFIPTSDLPEEVSCMLVEDDHLWVGSKDGLRLYDRKGQLTKHFKASSQEPGSLHSSFVKSLYRDSGKNLWIGTWGGGLSLLNINDSTFTTYIESNGLPNNVVYSILEDYSGTLWLSTNLGISAFNPEGQTFRNFDFFDGLQSNEFNTGAYFKSASGNLYFGGIYGLSFFNPEEILQRHSVPSILITSITVNNLPLTFLDDDSLKNVAMIDKMRLPWKENDVGIRFTAIDFKQAQKQNFQYAIEDTVWYTTGNRGSLELIDLPTGHHEIKVRTRKPGRNWSQPVVLMAIDIVPPVWERAWFRIIALLSFFAIIFGVYRYRLARLRGMNVLLNKLVGDRTKEIQAKNEEIQVFMNSMSTLCAKVSPEGKLLLVNKTAELGTGLPREELLHTNFLDGNWWTFDPEVHSRVTHSFKAACSGNPVNYTEDIFVFNKVLTINFSLTPIFAPDKSVEYIVAEGRDITSLKIIETALMKQTNRLEVANKELEAFSYSVSHDLRSPLRAIHGYTKILTEDYEKCFDDEGKKMMISILENAEKMSQLIDDLLAFSRSGKAAIQLSIVDMSQVANSVLQDLKMSLPAFKAVITIHPLIPANTDKNLIVQVFTNLISNAIKYSSKKPNPEIEISSFTEKDEVIYYIKDNGVGFDMKYSNKLFGVFQRLHKNSEFNGTGVGLALVKRIISRQGGRVWAEAELGVGATFYFSLAKT